MANTKNSSAVKLLVLQRGWVVVGKATWLEEEWHVTNACVVRKWGTTRGLGQIASDGPTPNTVLDPCPPISAHELTVVFVMDCEDEKWLDKLPR